MPNHSFFETEDIEWASGNYWLEVGFDPTENCFVVAKNARSARSVEYRQWGESYDEIVAEHVMDIPKDIERRIVEHYKSVLQKRVNDSNGYDEDQHGDIDSLKKEISSLNTIEDLWPDYADHRPIHGYHWLLKELGAERYYLERRFVTEINGLIYETGSFEDYLSSLIPLKDPDERNITSVNDFKIKIKKLKVEKVAAGNLIYRGQRDAYWGLECGIQRYVSNGQISEKDRIRHEKRLIKKFKRQALPYIEGPNIPATDWEWVIMGQHYGLPTMLLDWSRDPLCALYFAVRGNNCDRDGIVYAYTHARPALNIKDATDPTLISYIELIEAPNISPRVLAQKSVFTAEPLFVKKDKVWEENGIVREWHVCANNVKKVRAELDELGINESSMFPNLEAICLNIKKALMKKKI